jgi:hypothetical protein
MKRLNVGFGAGLKLFTCKKVNVDSFFFCIFSSFILLKLEHEIFISYLKLGINKIYISIVALLFVGRCFLFRRVGDGQKWYNGKK